MTWSSPSPKTTHPTQDSGAQSELNWLMSSSTNIMPPIKHLAVKLLRKKPVQSSTHASLAASGAVPDSGFAFVHNSQGASAALDEFSGAISAALEYIDLKGGSTINHKLSWS